MPSDHLTFSIFPFSPCPQSCTHQFFYVLFGVLLLILGVFFGGSCVYLSYWFGASLCIFCLQVFSHLCIMQIFSPIGSGLPCHSS